MIAPVSAPAASIADANNADGTITHAGAGSTAHLRSLIAEQRRGRGPAITIERVDRIDSTNAELLRRTDPLPASGVFVLVAREQTAGRGRRGRPWLADPASSLIVSLAIDRPAADLSRFEGLALAIGVGLADAVQAIRERGRPGAADALSLKWPNDLLLGGAKTAGILIEARTWGDRCRLVVGVGVNLHGSAIGRAAVDQPVAGILDAITSMPDREQVAATIITALVDALDTFEREGLVAFRSRWERRDAFRDQPVAVREGDVVIEGIARGIDDRGALRIDDGGRVRAVTLGDASLRPAKRGN